METDNWRHPTSHEQQEAAGAPLVGSALFRLRQCLPARVRRALLQQAEQDVTSSRRQPSEVAARSSYDSQGGRRTRGDLLPLPVLRQATSDPTGCFVPKRNATSFALSQLRTTEEPYALTFYDCSYHVGGGQMILQDVSGSVAAGHVLAVMGPSGAGKTTLLSMLTLERRGGRGTGRITLSGQPLTHAMYEMNSSPLCLTSRG